MHLFSQGSEKAKVLSTKQFERSVIEYETELKELAEFVPKLANFEEYLCSKFEKGISLEIRENMSVTSSQSYKKVV